VQILPLPLIDRHARIAEDQRALAHRARCSDANKRLAGAAWQYDDSGPGPSVSEHLRQRLFLVRPDLRGRFQRNRQVGSCIVCSKCSDWYSENKGLQTFPEFIFFEHWKLNTNAFTADVLDKFRVDFERQNGRIR
jgi:hypothetical protein